MIEFQIDGLDIVPQEGIEILHPFAPTFTLILIYHIFTNK